MSIVPSNPSDTMMDGTNLGVIWICSRKTFRKYWLFRTAFRAAADYVNARVTVAAEQAELPNQPWTRRMIGANKQALWTAGSEKWLSCGHSISHLSPRQESAQEHFCQATGFCNAGLPPTPSSTDLLYGTHFQKFMHLCTVRLSVEFDHFIANMSRKRKPLLFKGN